MTSTIWPVWRFEQVVALLFDGFFDDLPDAAALTARLGAARVRGASPSSRRCCRRWPGAAS